MTPERQLDPEALGDHIDRLYRAAWGLCGSREEAEDLVQETFARVLRKPRFLRSEDDLGYLLRVLRNTFFSPAAGRPRAGLRPPPCPTTSTWSRTRRRRGRRRGSSRPSCTPRSPRCPTTSGMRWSRSTSSGCPIARPPGRCECARPRSPRASIARASGWRGRWCRRGRGGWSGRALAGRGSAWAGSAWAAGSGRLGDRNVTRSERCEFPVTLRRGRPSSRRANVTRIRAAWLDGTFARPRRVKVTRMRGAFVRVTLARSRRPPAPDAAPAPQTPTARHAPARPAPGRAWAEAAPTPAPAPPKDPYPAAANR